MEILYTLAKGMGLLAKIAVSSYQVVAGLGLSIIAYFIFKAHLVTARESKQYG
jgi:glucose dehydrogenase